MAYLVLTPYNLKVPQDYTRSKVFIWERHHSNITHGKAPDGCAMFFMYMDHQSTWHESIAFVRTITQSMIDRDTIWSDNWRPNDFQRVRSRKWRNIPITTPNKFQVFRLRRKESRTCRDRGGPASGDADSEWVYVTRRLIMGNSVIKIDVSTRALFDPAYKRGVCYHTVKHPTLQKVAV